MSIRYRKHQIGVESMSISLTFLIEMGHQPGALFLSTYEQFLHTKRIVSQLWLIVWNCYLFKNRTLDCVLVGKHLLCICVFSVLDLQFMNSQILYLRPSKYSLKMSRTNQRAILASWYHRSVFYYCIFWTGTHNICLFHFNLLYWFRVQQ